ncbi:MAG TPA: bifunctional phosphoribosyl-AMP cyclohydrolase/phosphoribosyl-ATP diphosphatase HisIE [Chloroflexota bacterium]|jgi:phosphoribosyl-ATP pyrophosphohydrolase/phosphoribosyl-AMP cyclohydrolase|nr:bifunctional phosphoribosyl-AMP cyclohydrolase/phosphoribosyl-ATP diphosphatase HisIE [Chloroflexota bacterium]
MRPEALNYSMAGLLAIVAQDHRSGQVLMVGYANQEAVQKTVETGHAWFFSRSRQRLWEKGESSGNFLNVKGVRVDCDADALIYLCEPVGPTCHTGAPSCFFQTLDGLPPGETSGEAAAELFDTILQRQHDANPESSYVARLISSGVDRIGKKVGEEATEVVIAAKNADPAELAHEIADLWFHTYVLLAQQGMTPEDVWAELRGRRRH